MKKRFAVLGLGQFGEALARELCALGAEVLAVDISAKKVDAIRDSVSMAAAADIRDRDALEELFTSTFDVAVVSVGGPLEPAIMATLHLRNLPVREIWAEATTPDREVVLTRVGATQVISPERDMGRRVARRLAQPDLIESLPITEGYSVVQVESPPWTYGRTLGDLDLRRKMNLAVIAVRGDDGVVVVPGAETELHEGYLVTLVGRDADIDSFRNQK